MKTMLQTLRRFEYPNEQIALLSHAHPGYEAKYRLLKTLYDQQLNSMDYVMVRSKERMQTLYSDFQTYLKEPLFVYDEKPISASHLLKALFILLIGFMVAKIYHHQFIKLHNRRKDLNTIVIKVIANVGFTVIFLIALFMAISSVGLSIANLAVIAGALSIGVGFALRSIVSHYLAGILILSEKNIRLGHFISVEGKQVGKVVDIGLRATTLRTVDNTHHIIPNSDLVDKEVLNLTLEDRIRRIYVPFKVSYGSDINRVKKLILEAVNASKIKILRDIYGKKPTIWMRNMGESFIELDLLVWVEGYRPSIKSSLLILMHQTLLEHGIEMPNPQLDVYIKKGQHHRRLSDNWLNAMIHPTQR